jgi:hypothetical protein
MGVGVGLPGDCGSNVTSSLLETRAVHWVADGHATLVGPHWPPSHTPVFALVSIVVEVGVPGESGSNVTSLPRESTSVHWVADGHARAFTPPPGSIRAGVGVPGDCGSNVTSSPVWSTAVHWLADGH